jgi:hypothetical protein
MTDFGRDIGCTTGLRTGTLVRGARLIGEAAYRRLTTRRGTLRGGRDEAEYGLFLPGVVGSTSPRLAAVSLPGRISTELLKDARIAEVDVDVQLGYLPAGAALFTVTIRARTAVGPFELVLRVSDVTTELVGLEA